MIIGITNRQFVTRTNKVNFHLDYLSISPPIFQISKMSSTSVFTESEKFTQKKITAK